MTRKHDHRNSVVGSKSLCYLLPTDTKKLFARWQGPYQVTLGFVQDTNVPEEGDEICVWETTNQLANEAMLGAELTDSQREDVQSLIAKYSNVWSVVPGRTDKIAHAIETGSCRLVRQPSYRIPQAYKAEVLSEVQKMRQAGVIEPSTSQWSFPIVPVRKKDGSLRICYRLSEAEYIVSWRCISYATYR